MKFNWRENNQIDLLINGEEYFPRVFDRIRKAKQEILLETFIIFDDKVGRGLKEALLEAAAREVRIEIIVDGYGTANLPQDYIAELVSAGVFIRMFDPRPRVLGMRTNIFHRLHRKIVVVDAEVAFIGGINFGADHLGDFGPMAKQDYAVEVMGPIVADLRRASLLLLRDYAAITDLPDIKPLPPVPGHARAMVSIRNNSHNRDDIEKQYLAALRSARHRVIIANAYFLPSYRLLRELRRTARRGVKVILILQGQPDMPWLRAFTSLMYNYLLRHGVTIHEYCRRPLHGKVAIVDDEWSTIGSSNLDPLSLSLNLEANLVILDRALNRRLHDHLTRLADSHCEQITARIAVRGSWWRAPLATACFHFLRHFPTMAGMLPAHTQRLEPLVADPCEDPAAASAGDSMTPDPSHHCPPYHSPAPTGDKQ